MKKYLFISSALLMSLVLASCGGVDYENPEEVKECLVNHAYKANEGDVEVVLHFFKSSEGSLTSYCNGSPVGSDQIFHFDVGTPTEDGGVKIEASIGEMQLEDDGRISYLYKGDWFFFREWGN
jgi:hypothetical protein